NPGSMGSQPWRRPRPLHRNGTRRCEPGIGDLHEHIRREGKPGLGGVGYEKMILTAQLMQNVTSDRIIPVIRANEGTPLVPIFLGSKVYVDFRDDLAYESKYGELVREIHGQKIKPRPPLGANPFLI